MLTSKAHTSPTSLSHGLPMLGLFWSVLFSVTGCGDAPVSLMDPEVTTASARRSGGGRSKPGTVSDLVVVASTETALTLEFTEVDDGLGSPAQYEMRAGAAGSNWKNSSPIRTGTCTAPLQGLAPGLRLSCTAEGLAPGTAYDVRLVAFRGTLDGSATWGSVSDPVTGVTASPGVESVQADHETVSFEALGDTIQLNAMAFDGHGFPLTDVILQWESSQPGVVTVDSSGRVAAVSNGPALVFVSSGCCGASDTVAVSVAQRPAKVEVAPVDLMVNEGDTAALDVQVLDARGNEVAGASVDWTSLDPGVAAVDSAGKLVGLRAGTTAVEALADSLVAQASITVVSLQSEEMDPGLVGECAQPGPGWLWCDDFDVDRTASYFEYSDPGSFALGSAAGVNGSGGMEARFAQGQVSAGSLKLAFGRTPTSYMSPVDAGTEDYRDIYWRVFVRNQEGWTGGGGEKLTRATVFAGSNWAQAAIGHVWSGGAGERYLVLDPASGTDEAGVLKTTRYNDFANLRFLGQRPGTTPLFDDAEVGRWRCVEVHMKLNGNDGTNGAFELWIDGSPEVSATNLNWVGAYADFGINTIVLENYWNDGSPKAQSRFMDNFVVSTEPIGCGSASPPPPTLPSDPVLDVIEVAPGSAQLDPGEERQFTVMGTYSDGSRREMLNADFSGTTGGTITATGRYSAGSVPGSYQVRAEAGGYVAAASVTIAEPPVQGPTNEPAGFEPIVERPFNSKAAPGSYDEGTGSFPNKVGGSEGWDSFEQSQSNLTIVDAPGDPLSGGKAMRITYPVGLSANNGPGVAQTRDPGVAYRGLYVRTSLRLGPTYYVGSVGNKLYFHRMPGDAGRAEPFLALFNNGSGGFQAAVNFQGAPDGARDFFKAAGLGSQLKRDRWYVFETYLQLNSAPGVKDGIFRWWIDGELVLERTDVDYLQPDGPGRWGYLHVSPTFGGFSGAPNATEFWWEMGHSYVSGRR